MSKERLYSSADIINAFVLGFDLGDGYGWQCCNDGHNEDAKIALKEHIDARLTEERDQRHLPAGDMKDLREIMKSAVDIAINDSMDESFADTAYRMTGRYNV